MPSSYRPLYLLENRQAVPSRLRRFLSLGKTPRARHIEQQMVARTTFPDEAWGGAGLRRDVAKAISEIIQDEIGWPNANFQPEDPMDKVLFNFDWDGSYMDGCEIECSILRIEELLKVDIAEEFSAMRNGTFGEAVDTLIAKSPDAAVCLRQNLPLPMAGPEALEAKHCSSLAAFLDIREFLAKVLSLDRKSILPATPISRFGKAIAKQEIDNYVSARFGVSGCASPHRPWRLAVKAGMWLSAATIIPGFLFLGRFTLPAAVIVLLVALCVALRRLPEAHRMAGYRVRTLGDLVKCICAERARKIERTHSR